MNLADQQRGRVLVGIPAEQRFDYLLCTSVEAGRRDCKDNVQKEPLVGKSTITDNSKTRRRQ
jgi:hypothetical protein